jgi:hypothetical protein
MTLDPQVKAAIDRTMATLQRKKFRADPVVPDRYARAGSISGSAQKRHGLIIQLAMFRALAANPDLIVWNEPRFYIHSAADHVCEASPAGSIAQSSLDYIDRQGRKVELDLVVFRPAFGCLSSYEVKRGNGSHDAGKTRQIERDLICTQLLLHNYGLRRGLAVTTAEAHFVSYYGQGAIKPPWSISAEHLDEHFGCSVVAEVNAATAYMNARLTRLLDDWHVDLSDRQLSLLPPLPVLP